MRGSSTRSQPRTQPATSRLPAGASSGARLHTPPPAGPSWRHRSAVWPTRMSCSSTVPASQPVTTQCGSIQNRPCTASGCAWSTLTQDPAATSHRRGMQSPAPADATTAPSPSSPPRNRTARMVPLWPLRPLLTTPLSAWQILSSLSLEPLTSSCLSRCQSSAYTLPLWMFRKSRSDCSRWQQAFTASPAETAFEPSSSLEEPRREKVCRLLELLPTATCRGLEAESEWSTLTQRRGQEVWYSRHGCSSRGLALGWPLLLLLLLLSLKVTCRTRPGTGLTGFCAAAKGGEGSREWEAVGREGAAGTGGL
mmetsp:Transcript_11534/g.17332  ORF Transcript_11534/g.17332 Transcript_11534/m.17332 type:complete len:309 (-) Transcript_11534:556-1482(-)